jgi:thiamine-phosphate pyrophosphorylase
MPFHLPPIYPILDATILPSDRPQRDRFLAALLAELIDAGATLLQYRNKKGTDAEIVADARILRATASSDRCRLILNDWPDLLAETGFDGVHIGQEDMSPVAARSFIGPERILGVSTHNAAQLRAANRTAADYLAIGPVFATTTKEKPDPVVGLDGVKLARSLTQKPLVAIGGISLANCRSVRDAGADSVAVISAIFSASSGGTPGKLAKDFFAEFR